MIWENTTKMNSTVESDKDFSIFAANIGNSAYHNSLELFYNQITSIHRWQKMRPIYLGMVSSMISIKFQSQLYYWLVVRNLHLYNPLKPLAH